MGGGAAAGAAAFGRLLGVAQIVDGFIGRVGTDVMQRVIFFRRADPAKTGPVELALRLADQLFEIERWIERADGQAVGFGQSIDKIPGNQAAGARASFARSRLDGREYVCRYAAPVSAPRGHSRRRTLNRR